MTAIKGHISIHEIAGMSGLIATSEIGHEACTTINNHVTLTTRIYVHEAFMTIDGISMMPEEEDL